MKSSWNKGLTKKNDERLKIAAQNMSSTKKKNPDFYKRIAVENGKKAAPITKERWRKYREVSQKNKEELNYIKKEINKLNKIEKLITQLKKYKNKKEAFESMTIKEKVEMFLYKKNSTQTLNNLQRPRDWFFNETKRLLYESTSFLKEENIRARLYAIWNDLKEHPTCKICNKKLVFTNNSYSMYCSSAKCKNLGRYLEKLPIIIDKIKDYVVPLFDIENWKGVRNSHKWKCIKCNTIFESNWLGIRIPRCPKCYPTRCNKGISSIEIEISSWVSQIYNGEIISNYRLYEKRKNNIHFYREADIYIPEYNFGIELNGIYWHSELNGKYPEYHKEKTEFFKKYNIDIIQIWDIEWINNKKIIQSIISNKLGLSKSIYARKCTIQEISKKQSDSFLINNHIQGNSIDKVRLGLFYNNELIQVLTMSKPRFNPNYEWEINRFGTLLNHRVTGGFTKLLTYFVRQYEPKNIITYADLRFGNGDVYNKANFKLKGKTNTNYFYTKDYLVLESRIKFQKHKLEQLLENYDKDLTEWENMQLNGYDRIWDCGNAIYDIKFH